MPKPETGIDPAQLVVAATQAPLEAAWAELGSVVATDLLEVLRRGASRHRELVGSLGLDAEPPEEWEARADRLLEYRRVVASELLEPLIEAFGRAGPAAASETALSEAIEECVSRCRDLPAEVVTTWPQDALKRKPSDTRRRRLGKFFARGFSKARKAGGERTLPLRSVALRHLERVVEAGQDELVVVAMIEWAGWGNRLERAWIEWGSSALPPLVRAELPGDEDALEHWEAARGAAAGLQAGLEALAEEEPHQAAAADATARLQAARGALEADLAVAGSFLLRGEGHEPAPALRRMQSAAPALKEWDEGIAARMRLYVSLLAILSGATSVQRRLVRSCRERSLSRVTDLLDVAKELSGFLDALRKPETDVGLRQALHDLDARIGPALEPAHTALPDSATVDASIREVSDATVEALLAMIRQAPPSLLLHSVAERPPSGARKAETRPLPLQELARQSFDALRIERIRSSTAGLVNVIDDIRGDLTGLPEVFSFARDEAIRELDAGGPGAHARAVDLATGAVRRMAESLRARVEDLDAVLAQAQRRLAAEICDGSLALLDRVGAGRMQAQLLAARSRIADLIGWIGDTWTPPIRRAIQSARNVAGRARRRVSDLLRKAKTLAGGPVEEASSARAIRTLAEAQKLVDRLPLVYQRLFTLEPLADSALLAGRASELESVMKRWRRWRSQKGVPLVIRGRQGSGITSFVNVFAGEIQADGGGVVQIDLRGRMTDEQALARLLAARLSLPSCDSLGDVAHAIFDTNEAALPAAVLLDNLEHVYLRVPQGTDVIERLLTLMAETEPRIFWVGSISSSAWQLVSTEEPTAVSQVDVFDLQALGPEATRAAVLMRHRRSGLDVRYEEPTAGRALLRRRLHRMRDREGYRQLLETDFFERLYRTSGGYLGLALFQWLMAADFESGDGVFVRQPERPDFSVLDTLDLTQNFTLKAFLEHRTLTLGEHDRVFRLPRHESYQIFESLRNRNLIEAVTDLGSDGHERSEIEEDLRYRVVPLLTGAVIEHLQGRNIVH